MPEPGSTGPLTPRARCPARPSTTTGPDSCHTVWFELHEDLIATLGVRRA